LKPFRTDARITVVRGTVPAELDLGSVFVGEKTKVAFDPRNVDIVGKAPLFADKGEVTLDATHLPPGDYKGTLEARCGASTRAIKVKALVLGRGPAKLSLQASWGWTKTVLELGGAATFKLEPLVLAGAKAQIDPDLDMRTVELGGGKYELRVFAPASLPEGRYTGVVTISVSGEEKNVPLTLEVKR
jgi:hypothetical protein